MAETGDRRILRAAVEPGCSPAPLNSGTPFGRVKNPIRGEPVYPERPAQSAPYKPNAVRRGANRSKTPCPAW